jgi:hypothetical protein
VELAETDTIVKAGGNLDFLIVLFFDPEAGGDIFLQNVG